MRQGKALIIIEPSPPPVPHKKTVRRLDISDHNEIIQSLSITLIEKNKNRGVDN